MSRGLVWGHTNNTILVRIIPRRKMEKQSRRAIIMEMKD